MADASDGPHSSLSLGLAHDVFALPLHCQRLNSAATPLAFFDKSGPSVRATDIHLTATLIHSQVPRPATDINYFNLCAALSGHTMKALRCEECLLQLLSRFCIHCNLLGKMMFSLAIVHCTSFQTDRSNETRLKRQPYSIPRCGQKGSMEIQCPARRGSIFRSTHCG